MAKRSIKRKMRKRGLEAIRRRRRTEDPTYWRYSGSVVDEAAEQRFDDDLQAMGVTDLRKMGGRLKIKGCWAMRKPALIRAILDADSQDVVSV